MLLAEVLVYVPLAVAGVPVCEILVITPVATASTAIIVIERSFAGDAPDSPRPLTVNT